MSFKTIPAGVFRFVADISKWNIGMSKVRKDIVDLGHTAKDTTKSVANIGNRVAGLSLAVVGLSGTLTKFASDAQEIENLFKVSLGDEVEKSRKFIDDYRRSIGGFSQLELKTYIGQLNLMINTMTGLSEQSRIMAEDLTQIALGISSLFNIPVSHAFQKVRAGLVGETEPLRAIGIIVDETTAKHWALSKGLIEVGEQMTQAQKAMIRYALIVEQTKKAAADVGRTQNDFANAFRASIGMIRDLLATLGEQFREDAEVALRLFRNALFRLHELLESSPNLVYQLTKALEGLFIGASIVGAYLILMASQAIPAVTSAFRILRIAILSNVAALNSWLSVATIQRALTFQLGGSVLALSTSIGAVTASISLLLIKVTLLIGLFYLIRGFFDWLSPDLDFLALWINEFGRDIMTIIKTVAKGITFLINLWRIASSALSVFVAVLGDTIANIDNIIKMAGESIVATIAGFLHTVLTSFKQSIPGIGNVLDDELAELERKMQSSQGDLSDAFKDMFEDGFQETKNATIEVGKAFDDLMNGNVVLLGKSLEELEEDMSNLGEGFRSVVGDAADLPIISNAIEAFRSDIAAIGGLFGEIVAPDVKLPEVDMAEFREMFEMLRDNAEKFNGQIKETPTYLETQLASYKDIAAVLYDHNKALSEQFALRAKIKTATGEELEELQEQLTDKNEQLAVITENINNAYGKSPEVLAKVLEQERERLQLMVDMRAVGLPIRENQEAQLEHLERMRAKLVELGNQAAAIKKLDEVITNLKKAMGDGEEATATLDERLREFNITAKSEMEATIEKAQELAEELRKAGRAFDANVLTKQINTMRREIGQLGPETKSFSDKLKEAADRIPSLEDAVIDGSFRMANAISSNITSSIMGMMRGTMTAEEAFASFAMMVIEQIIAIGVQFLVMKALQSAMVASTTAEVTASGAAITSAMAPAAAASSIASFGTAAVVGIAAVALALGAILGMFMSSQGSLAQGTAQIPYSGLYTLHQGEAVIPKYDADKVTGEQSLTIVNVTDPKEVLQVLNSSEGERIITNVVSRRNRRVTISPQGV